MSVVFLQSLLLEKVTENEKKLLFLGIRAGKQFSSLWELRKICHLQQIESPQEYIKIILTNRTDTWEVIWRKHTE